MRRHAMGAGRDARRVMREYSDQLNIELSPVSFVICLGTHQCKCTLYFGIF